METLVEELEALAARIPHASQTFGGRDLDKSAMCRAAARIRELEGAAWKPIATAPRDGTRILAWNAMVGVYNTAFTTRWTGEPEEYRAGTYQGFPCGFWSTGIDTFPFGQWDCQPTHWMPVPDPPPYLPSTSTGLEDGR